MDSYSDVAIAIDKATFAKHALLKSVPALLLKTPYVEHDGELHWYLESQLWDSAISEVREVHAFFDLLYEEGEIPSRTFCDPNNPDVVRTVTTKERFGCVILCGNNETEEHGEPFAYGLELVCYVDCPGRDAMLKREGLVEHYSLTQEIEA